jgi:argininosuccinate lyase
MLSAITLNKARMAEAAEEDFTCATDVADYLAKKGLPFRTAHGVTGKLVRYCLEHETTLDKVPMSVYKAECDLFEEDILVVVKAPSSADHRNSVGGSSKAMATRGIASVESRLAALKK